jgi:hypothetical protein
MWTTTISTGITRRTPTSASRNRTFATVRNGVVPHTHCNSASQLRVRAHMKVEGKSWGERARACTAMQSKGRPVGGRRRKVEGDVIEGGFVGLCSV